MAVRASAWVWEVPCVRRWRTQCSAYDGWPFITITTKLGNYSPFILTLYGISRFILIVNATNCSVNNKPTDIHLLQFPTISVLALTDIGCNCTEPLSLGLLLPQQPVAFTIDLLIPYSVKMKGQRFA